MSAHVPSNFKIQLSGHQRQLIIDTAAALLLILFMYTAANKFLTINSFSSTLSKSPLIGTYGKLIAWLIPIIETVIALLLTFNVSKKLGLLCSFLLMSLFTVYLIYMILSASKLPCHCGGVISTMSWKQHIWFNLIFIVLATTGFFIKEK